MRKIRSRLLIALFPLIAIILCAALSLLVVKSDTVIPRLDFILNAIISCVSTITGFIMTSYSILIGLSAHSLMKELKKTGGLKELNIRYAVSLILGLVVLCGSILLGGTAQEEAEISRAALSISLFVISVYLLSIITTCYYLIKIISLLPYNKVAVDTNASVPPGEFRIGKEYMDDFMDGRKGRTDNEDK